MKTFFYKKLIPLAMITSLTATSMATVAEAAQVQTDAPETAVETADVPAAVPADLAASIANNAPVVMEDEETEDPGDDNTDPANGDEDDKKDEGNEGDTPAPPAATDDLKFADDAKIEAAFDISDDADVVKTFEVKVAKSAKVTAKVVKPANVVFLDANDKEVTDIVVTAAKIDGSNVVIEGEVKGGAAATAAYKVKIGTFTSVNTVAFSRTKGWVDTVESGNSYYYKGTNEAVKLPDAHDTTSFTTFAKGTGAEANTNVRKITLGNSVRTIGADAFVGWTNLSVVEFIASPTTIPSTAFDTDHEIAIIVDDDTADATIDGLKGSLPGNVHVYKNKDFVAAKSVKAGDTFTASFSALSIAGGGDVTQLERVAPVEGNAKIATDAELDAADKSKVKWVVKGNAKFAKLDKDGKIASYSLANVTGAKTVYIGNTKASGKFNSIVTVTVQVPVTVNKKTTYKDAYSATLYVNPTNATSLTATGKTAGTTKFEVPTAEAGGNCKLEMDEGASFKPTISVNKEASNKALAYAVNGDCVTVVNGTVKAVAAGKATITVTPVDADEAGCAPIEIDVTVNAKTTKAQLNTNSITVVPDAEPQEVTLSAVPASNKTVKAKATFNKELFDIKINGKDASNEVEVDGAATVTVALKMGKKAEDVKATDKKVDLTIDGKTVKLTVNAATAPQNLKKINEKSKVKKGDDTVKINIPVGGVQTLGVSANPATADNALNWAVAGDKESLSFDDVEPMSDDDEAGLTVKGDVVKATKTGKYFVQAQSRGLAEDNKPRESQVYEINVYDPGSSIVWDEEIDSKTGEDAVVDYVIKGDYLMTKTNAREGSDKTVLGGKDIVIAVPDLTGITKGYAAEKVNWTVSDPSKVKLIVNDDDDTMTINVGVKGTYTITGTTEFTKQKYTFKVNALENWTTASAVDGNIKVGVEGAEADGDGVYNITKGDKIQAFADLEGMAVAGKVTFTSSDKTVANVNAKGQITALKASDTAVTITATFDKAAKTATGGAKTATIKVKVGAPEVTSNDPVTKIATNAGINTSVTVSGAPDASAKWYCRKVDGAETPLMLAVKDGKVFTAGSHATGKSAKVIFEQPGVYTVYAKDGSGNQITVESEIEVFDVVVKTASVVEPYTVALKDWANKKIGISLDDPNVDAEGKVKLAIKATGVDENGKTVMASGEEITWTSSNVNIATAENDPDKDDVLDPYSHVVITLNKNNYEGAVTLTGTIKNSGKKVKVTLYVKAPTETKTPEAPKTED